MDCIYLQEPENLTSICLSFEEQPIIGIVTAILNGHSDAFCLSFLLSLTSCLPSSYLSSHGCKMPAAPLELISSQKEE